VNFGICSAKTSVVRHAPPRTVARHGAGDVLFPGVYRRTRCRVVPAIPAVTWLQSKVGPARPPRAPRQRRSPHCPRPRRPVRPGLMRRVQDGGARSIVWIRRRGVEHPSGGNARGRRRPVPRGTPAPALVRSAFPDAGCGGRRACAFAAASSSA
jgi:hypothetical protein